MTITYPLPLPALPVAAGFSLAPLNTGAVLVSPHSRKQQVQSFDGQLWSIEIALRIDPVFGGPISAGQAFDFNFCRTRSEIVGDDFDILQQWSNTGTSSGSRYRFGEVVFGSLSDRLREIADQLAQELERPAQPATKLSAAAKKSFTATAKKAKATLRKMRRQRTPKGDAVRAYDREAASLMRAL
ncbi:MAG: hypothetical protein IIC53_14580, partial [Proteobacteria bacterium]|nr:hypothetical protein [Pseudomonadota bacterium]